MQILQELIGIITKVKLRAIRKLGFPFATDNQLDEMYELLAEDKSEEEVALQLTGKVGKHSTFRGLKADLIDRLVASLFLVDLSLPSYNTRQNAYFEVHKKWAAAKILLGKNARSAGVDLAEQVFQQAQRYEFNDLAADIARNLRMVFATVIGDPKKYLFYVDACKELQKVVSIEDLAEENYARMIMEFHRNSKTSDEATREEARRAYEELKPYLSQTNSYTLHLYSSMLHMSSYKTTVEEYPFIIEVCDETIRFFEQKKYVASVPLQAAYYQKLVCLFQLRQFDQTHEFAERGLNLLQEGSYNWFKFQETYFLLALHSKQYSEAYRVHQRAVTAKRFHSLTDEVKEYWRILGAYLHYLIELGEIPEAQDNPQFTKFKIGRFLNETPLFSKDKSGMNVSILLVQILFFVARSRYNDTHEKMDAVEQYARRHLFQQSTLRAFYFIKAVLELPKNSFHKVAVERKAAKHLEKMELHPLEQAGRSHFNTEIIPFEDLWTFLTSQLGNKFH